ncbi:MAG: hypothetical protein L7W40_12060 [Akkermansiaceae bacterium]|nr:hypothetical protein [Akkermansiaceae bacterium]
MLKNSLALFLVVLLSFGCSSEEDDLVEEAPFPEIEKIQLLVIHHRKNGDLISYLALEKVPANLRAFVEPTDGNQELFVTVLGTKRHDLLKRSFSISSQIGENSHGKITVIVENGLAVSIDGNGFHSPALVSIDSLDMIEQALAQGNMGLEGPSTITISNQEVE